MVRKRESERCKGKERSPKCSTPPCANQVPAVSATVQRGETRETKLGVWLESGPATPRSLKAATPLQRGSCRMRPAMSLWLAAGHEWHAQRCQKFTAAQIPIPIPYHSQSSTTSPPPLRDTPTPPDFERPKATTHRHHEAHSPFGPRESPHPSQVSNHPPPPQPDTTTHHPRS